MAAQTTFNVTVATKTAAHPYFGQGWPEGYVINGVEGAELTLTRGETYTFQMVDVPAIHPFYISTDAAGASAGVWDDGVTGNFATGNAQLSFTVPMSAPDELWYQCGSHQFMGWMMNIIDPTSTEGETPDSGFELSVAFPNPSTDRVHVGLSLDETSNVSVEVFDVAGRRVALLHEGLLQAGTEHTFVLSQTGLAGGVYVIRASDGTSTLERRITIVR
ncbi:MAG: T9SS type A sorting domain-containing protein [Rubricoccaceae bacterium]|nr:T9SS type A sorting domain-containing protein [Rubricoccaceae bacterium]